MKIADRKIGRRQPVLIIAEIGVNHDGSVGRALELVHHAAAVGADAVKLQIFRAGQLMHPSSGFAEYQQSRVNETDPTSMLRRYELADDDLRKVTDEIRKQRMIPLATPFSPQDVEVIQKLDFPAIKIASPDLVNRLLLEKSAQTTKPLIVSTGAATMQEVEQTVHWLRQWRAEFVLMHCVSSYPTPNDQMNLGWISELAEFGEVGYSDHSTDLLAGALATAAGACIVEKHLTYDRNAQGPDHSASADPRQFAEYVRLIRHAETMRGRTSKQVLPVERDVRNVSRQSLVLKRDLQPGEKICLTDLTVQRPGSGIAPAEIDQATGKFAKVHLLKGTLLQWEMLTDAA